MTRSPADIAANEGQLISPDNGSGPKVILQQLSACAGTTADSDGRGLQRYSAHHLPGSAYLGARTGPVTPLQQEGTFCAARCAAPESKQLTEKTMPRSGRRIGLEHCCRQYALVSELQVKSAIDNAGRIS